MHGFAGHRDMCNFMPVNLDNSMMKHMKQKLIALLWVTFAVVGTWASDSVVWHHPVVGYTHSIVEVTKVAPCGPHGSVVPCTLPFRLLDSNPAHDGIASGWPELSREGCLGHSPWGTVHDA